jgi:lipopolysaccharide transport system permease protein
VEKANWSHIIKAHTGLFDLKLSELWAYRDLIAIFIKRDFSTAYKQTILGPFWHLLQPLVSSLVFTFVFSYIGRIPHGEIPAVLFFLSGIVPFSYFSECVSRTAGTFTANSGLFGKVYFPRLAAPIAVVISNLIKFAIQMFLFLIIWTVFFFKLGDVIHPNVFILFTPFLLLIMALLGLGIGLIVSSLTIRYRDLANLLGFGIQFLMYMSPVMLPVSIWPAKVQWITYVNPITPIVDIFRFGFLGIGSFNGIHLLYSFSVSAVIFFIGIILFNKVEKKFIDTI